MSKRLTIIKDNYEMGHVYWEDLRWFIEQAEKAEEVETVKLTTIGEVAKKFDLSWDEIIEAKKKVDSD